MTRLFALLIGVSVLIVSCQSDYEVVEKTDTQGYVERYTVRKDNGAKEGWYVKSAPNTIIVEETQFENDLANGMSIRYFPNGDTMSVSIFKDGKLNGPATVYYPAGGISEELTYSNNSKTGPFKEYWKDGVIKSEGSYLNGREQGEFTEYCQQGHKIRVMDCYEGVCTTKWTDPDHTH